MRDTLSKFYPNLSSDERFRLAIKALAEGNTLEQKRLRETCPRKSYSMNDLEFVDRMDGADILTMAVVADLKNLNDQINLSQNWLEYNSVLLELFNRLPADNGKRAFNLMGESLSKTHLTLTDTMAMMKEKRKALWVAYAEFCHETFQLEPEIFISAIFPIYMENLKIDFDDNTPIVEQIKTLYKTVIKKFWEKSSDG